MAKLWEKGYSLNKEVEHFTVGNDFLLDYKLLGFDCKASIAHAKMLKKIGLLKDSELKKLVKGLNEIIILNKKGKFKINPLDEDCHTAIENYLIKKSGVVGKKINTARSRNDQVLTALRLYEKNKLTEIKKLLIDFKNSLKKNVTKNGVVELPGYTHMQKAMPTTIGTWLNCFADSCNDNLLLLDSVLKLIDQSPLGSAAGFGVPVFKLDKKMTAKEMGFSKVMSNPIHAQLSRGKFESVVINLLTQIMFDLNKLATDLILFNMQELGFVSLPKEFCTGSSIMPQKKNPDVLELVRAKYHVVLGEEFKVKSLMGNLMSGYNRDMQLTKEPLFNSVDITKDCLKIMSLVVSNMKVNKNNCEAALTKELFATENAYELVKKGVPFREAYNKVAKDL